MIEKLKRFLPDTLLVWIRKKRTYRLLNKINRYNNRRAFLFSGTYVDNRNADLAKLMIESHTLEKGITMPNRRLGFGQDRVCSIITKSKAIIKRWGNDSVELQSALANLAQYLSIHKEAGYDLPEKIIKGIEELMPSLSIHGENCYSVNREIYFRGTEDFASFAKSRHSIRSFSSTPVDENKLMEAIQLAQTAPSACNRQATRVKIISSDEGKRLCCKMQRGNRGFGDSADKWLLITTEMGDWAYNHIQEGFIDAGIFVMNLLYALHYYNIAACTLNALFSPEEREQLREGLGYPESEEPVCFIVIGNPTDDFMVPKSARLKIEDIVQKI